MTKCSRLCRGVKSRHDAPATHLNSFPPRVHFPLTVQSVFRLSARCMKRARSLAPGASINTSSADGTITARNEGVRVTDSHYFPDSEAAHPPRLESLSRGILTVKVLK